MCAAALVGGWLSVQEQSMSLVLVHVNLLPETWCSIHQHGMFPQSQHLCPSNASHALGHTWKARCRAAHQHDITILWCCECST
jgi:hypothetical protein